jgi:signal transduction histidine kinase/CheY-like chemotaxis protein
MRKTVDMGEKNVGMNLMNKSASGFESELRLSPGPVIVALALLGLVLVSIGQFQSDSSIRMTVLRFALLFYGASAISWLLGSWRPWAGRWVTIVASIILIVLGDTWVGLSGFLTLLVIPTVLAVAMIGIPGAIVTVVGETVLLSLLPRLISARVEPVTVAIALVATWGMLGIMIAVYRPIHHVAQWSWEYYYRARDVLEEARDRKAELEQALEDLTHANRQLALANERITALRLVAEEAQKAKTRFVARVSHEFRTPLNMIIGLVDLMVESPEMYDVTLSPRMRGDLKVVHRNSEHLSNMINDVLDLTRIEADRLVLHKERVDIEKVINSAAEAVSPLLQSKQLALSISVPEDLPKVYCDRTRIEQVILNLMSNAARYTEEGKVAVAVARQGQHILASVTDTGPGIPLEDVERIFEPFCQGTSEIWRDKGGSGLGLSISKQFVELHGGRMWVESVVGAGTTFIFELPISAPIAHISKPGHQIREDWIWHERRSRSKFSDAHYKPRIVICDPTGDLHAALAHYSEEVEFVDTPLLSQVTNVLQQGTVHAVVLNVTDSDGVWSLVEAVKREAPRTPVIGGFVPRRVERAIALGVLGYLIKPVTRSDLMRAIQSTGKSVRRVLVVDDDPDTLQLFSQMLYVCDSTLEVVTALSGKEALGKLRHHPPDLMLIDIVMPGMDGWQVLESITRDDRVGKVPAYFVSAQDPADQPPTSQFLLVVMDEGLPISKFLRCSLEVSKLLLQPEEGLGLAPA